MDLMYNVVYTETAINDLNRILSYLSGYKNLMILTRFKEEIDERLYSIKKFPKSHSVIFKQHGYDYRKLIIRNYIFVYYIDEKNQKIIIFRIFHELEDYQGRLGVK